MDIMKMGDNPKYLGSWDLYEQPSKEITLTIRDIRDEKVIGGGMEEICTVIYWQENAKPMIANVTNKKNLAKLYHTKDTDKLIGKRVIIGIDRVKAFGDVYDALRIRIKMPAAVSVTMPKCEVCGQDIQSYGSMSADAVAEYALKKYGKRVCRACGQNMKEEQT